MAHPDVQEALQRTEPHGEDDVMALSTCGGHTIDERAYRVSEERSPTSWSAYIRILAETAENADCQSAEDGSAR